MDRTCCATVFGKRRTFLLVDCCDTGVLLLTVWPEVVIGGSV